MRWLSPPDSEPRARGQREIIEADIVEEGEPLADLFEDARGDLVLLRGELGGQFARTSARPPGSTCR